MSNMVTQSVSFSSSGSLWDMLPSQFDLSAIEPVQPPAVIATEPGADSGQDASAGGQTASPAALDEPLDLATARAMVASNFGFIDGPASGAAGDGSAGLDDLVAAAQAGVLRQSDARMLAAVARSPALFSGLDARDGAIDGRISFSALVRAHNSDELELKVGAPGAEVPGVFDARYNRDFTSRTLAIQANGGVLDRAAVNALTSSPLSDSCFAALDALDGLLDGKADGAAMRSQFDQQHRLFDAPANDGSGTVFQACLRDMLADYAAIDRHASDITADDTARVQFAAAMSARLALSGGIPMDQGGDGFNADIDNQFVGSALLDEKAVSAACDALLANPAIQQDLSDKMRKFTPDLITQTRSIEGRISSPLYADILRAMESTGQADQAKARATQDVAALRLLDPRAAERASARLLENMAASVIDEADFATLPQETSALAIDDVLQTMIALKAGRVGLRETGRLATMLSSIGDIKAELFATKEAVTRFSANLANLFNFTRSAGGDVSDAKRLLDDVEMSSMKNTISEPERQKIKTFIQQMDRVGAWQTGAAIFGVIGGVYRLAHPGAQPWDRLYAAQEFLASASYVSGPAKAFGEFLGRGISGGGGFTTAMKVPLIDLVRASGAASGSDLARGSMSISESSVKLPSSAAVSVEAMSAQRAAAVVKGLSALTEVGSAVMGIAIGAKVIADGVANDDTAQTVLGSITLTAGVATMTGAALGAAFAIGTPILIFGGALSMIGLVVSMLLQKTGDQVMGDELEKRWGESGFLKAGWREQLTHWWVDHTNIDTSLELGL